MDPTRRTCLALAALLATSCGGDTTAPDEEPTVPLPTLSVVECSGLSPAATSGMPLDDVALGELPAALQTPVLARVSTDDGTEMTLAFVRGTAGAHLTVPLHPSGSAEGGAVVVRVSDEERTCARLSRARSRTSRPTRPRTAGLLQACPPRPLMRCSEQWSAPPWRSACRRISTSA